MGHAKGHLREQFRDLLEAYYNVSDDLAEIVAVEDRLWPLTGTLWNCTDTLPVSYREYIDWLIESADDDYVRLWKRSGTYGKAARIIRDLIASDRSARENAPTPKPRIRVKAISRRAGSKIAA